MFSKSTVYTLSLGLISSISLGIPVVNAQIEVTGGSMNGQAAFFVPKTISENNGINLYGVNIQQLNLQTTNGNTSQAVFNAINSQFTDVNANGLPDANDTGILQGNLSGVAFANGSPVGFSNRPTELEFTLNSFNSLLNLPGILAAPDNLETKLFLPEGVHFEGEKGNLQLGNFGANLDGGLIALPSNYRFADSSIVSNNRNAQNNTLRVKFQFRGNDVTPESGTSLDPNAPIAGEIQVYDVSNSNTKVKGVDANANLTQGQLFALVQNGKVIGYYSGTGVSITGDASNLIVKKDDPTNTTLFTGAKEALTTAVNTDLSADNFDDSKLTTPPDGVVNVPQGANGIVFIGQANEKFQVQTVGTRSTNEVKITTTNTLEASNAALAIAIGDIYQYEQSDEDFDLTKPLDYRIEGEANSVFSLLDPSLVAVVGGARRDTKFNFEQESTGASLEGRSNGFVAFAGLPGQTNFQEGLENLDTEAIVSSLNSNNCTVCSLGELDDDFAQKIEQAMSQEGTSISTTTSTSNNNSSEDDDNTSNETEVIDGNDNSEVGQTIYLLSVTSSQETRIVVINVSGDRYFVVVPGNLGHGNGRGFALGNRNIQQVIVFKQVGPSSRLFPGQGTVIEIALNDLPKGFAKKLEKALKKEGLVAQNITINNIEINNNINSDDNSNNNDD